MTKTGNLFLAVILSLGLFTELRIGAFPKFENGNAFPWFMFISAGRVDLKEYIPENWRCRTLSMELSAAWCDVTGGIPAKAAADRVSNEDARMVIWSASLMGRASNSFASYNAAFFFLTCAVIVLLCENPILPMLGAFASVLTSAPGSLAPYIMPWDMPTMLAWTVIFAVYSKLNSGKFGQEWIWLASMIAILGMLKETVLVTALFFIGAPWSWPKRVGMIIGTVIVSQLLNWGLFDARPDWLFSASNASAGGSRWNPLMLWPILLANAGSVALLPWLLWKKKDWPLAAVCGAFIILQAINNLACGVYNENRDWLELAPIGWTLISEQSAKMNR